MQGNEEKGRKAKCPKQSRQWKKLMRASVAAQHPEPFTLKGAVWFNTLGQRERKQGGEVRVLCLELHAAKLKHYANEKGRSVSTARFILCYCKKWKQIHQARDWWQPQIRAVILAQKYLLFPYSRANWMRFPSTNGIAEQRDINHSRVQASLPWDPFQNQKDEMRRRRTSRTQEGWGRGPNT